MSSAALAFGSEAVGATSAAKSVTVSNSGAGAASLTSISLAGALADDFVLSKTCGASLAPGAACTISVKFKPVAAGAKTATVNVVDNSAGSPQSIAVSGTGTSAGTTVTATPTYSPVAGAFTGPRLVIIDDGTAGASIYYTTDGSTPTTKSARYSGAICVQGTETLKAIAVKTGDSQSVVASGTFTISNNIGAVSTLHSFLGNPTDGQYPTAGVVGDSSGTVYGTTSQGGAYGYYNVNSGSVYKVTPCGIETMLHSFGSGTDGWVPKGELIPDGHGNFYGTTYGGGVGVSGGYGTVFKITPTGALTIVHSFPDAYLNGLLDDGIFPSAPVVADSAGNLYGTTIGGTDGNPTGGSVFRISASGAEKVLHNFGVSPDGRSVTSGLILGKDGNLWGTASGGGKNNTGMVFKVTPSGTETVVYSFGNAPDGINPAHGLVLASDGNFYGTTPSGGQYGAGTVFRLTPNGTETVIHSFGKGTDGTTPEAPLIQGTDGNLYGTTAGGGPYISTGTVFKISLSGNETVLYNFAPVNGALVHGAQPSAPVWESADGSLIGTTQYGGTDGFGVVFKLNRIVPLTSSGGSVTEQETFPDSPAAD